MTRESLDLDKEITAAKLLRINLGDLIADDEELAVDMVLAETGLNEAIQAAVELYCRDKTSVDGINTHIGMMEARRDRIARRMERLRALVQVAMEQAGRKSIETALGTATLKTLPPKVIVDPERESEIPSRFWKRADPKLDLKALKQELKDGAKIDGARLDNGGGTVAFSFR